MSCFAPFKSSSNVDDRTLHEIYVWPYARMVEAGIGGVMCSYNQIDGKIYDLLTSHQCSLISNGCLLGTWACEDEYTMNTVLKQQLGFRGLVMTDWGAQMSGIPSALAGLDMTMPVRLFSLSLRLLLAYIMLTSNDTFIG